MTKKKIQGYVFIDTNIYLDFYRSNNEANLKLLERLRGVKDRVICTYQVEAEYMKNRQFVVLQSVSQLKHNVDLAIPAVITDEQLTKSLSKLRDDAKSRTTKIRSRVAKILDNPRGNDKVFSVLEEIFSSKSDHVLTRDMEIKTKIKRLAWKRFMLGYPPRKASDTSIGDAVNWEWIVHCALSHPGQIIIVSRDCDYGHEYANKYYLNSQLKQEFRERVGNKSIVYTHKLSEALKHLEIQVTENEKKAEAAALDSRVAQKSESPSELWNTFFKRSIAQAQKESDDSMQKFNEFLRKWSRDEGV